MILLSRSLRLISIIEQLNSGLYQPVTRTKSFGTTRVRITIGMPVALSMPFFNVHTLSNLSMLTRHARSFRPNKYFIRINRVGRFSMKSSTALGDRLFSNTKVFMGFRHRVLQVPM